MSRGVKVFVLGMMLLGLAGALKAAQEDSCLLKVSCAIDLGVEISTPSGGVDFGSLNVDSDVVYTTAITTATNTSSENTVETYKVKIEEVGTHDWTIVQSNDPGTNEVTFGLVFRSTSSSAPSASDFLLNEDYLTTTYDWCDSSHYAVNGDPNTEKGYEVDPTVEAKRRMWFLVRTPKATSTNSEFTARVYVQANLPQ